MKPSPQQEAIYAAVSDPQGGSLRVDAVAGAGKTTTLIQAVALMQGSVAFAAYNKKIATEIEQRLGALGTLQAKVAAGTFHSFGFRAWRRVAPRVQVDDKKVLKLMQGLGIPEELQQFVRQAVSLAKQRAIGVVCPVGDPAAWQSLVDHFELDSLLCGGDTKGFDVLELDDLVKQALGFSEHILRLSIDSDSKTIDFDDMIYAPLVHDAQVWQNDWVLVDEAQDTNPARRALAKKMLKPGGRLVAVGDERQAIYGFTGADSDAMDLIEQEFGCTRLPLTVTYRCPKRVVTHARAWVEHITAHESAPEGIVREILDQDFVMLPENDLQKDDAVLCRNTKPLVELAYGFIRRRIPCHVEGRDIGRNLLTLVNKWKTRSVDALLERLEKHLAKETERFLAKGQEMKAEALADRIDTIGVIARALPAGSDLNALRAEIDRLFGDVEPGTPSPNLTLSTIHKAKGREWNRVYLYGRNRFMPSKYARQEWQMLQEDNLCYVAITRAKQELVEVVVAAGRELRGKEVQ